MTKDGANSLVRLGIDEKSGLPIEVYLSEIKPYLLPDGKDYPEYAQPLKDVWDLIDSGDAIEVTKENNPYAVLDKLFK